MSQTIRKITHLKVSAREKLFSDGAKTIECRPFVAKRPCMPQDEFDMVESCTICGKMF